MTEQDHCDIDKAHIVGLSMGAFATFYFGMQWPERALSLTLGTPVEDHFLQAVGAATDPGTLA